MNRPGFENYGRGRARVPGELGLLDPRAGQASRLEAQPNGRFSLAFTRSGNPLHYAGSVEDFRQMYGASAGITTGVITELTVACWVKTESDPAANEGILVANDATTGATGWGLDWFAALSGRFWVGGATTAANRSVIAVTNPSGQWNHFCGTYNRLDGSGATARLFINGDNTGGVNGNSTTTITLEHNVPFNMGRQVFRATSSTQYGDARIAEVMLWSRQLSGTEVTTLYNGGALLRPMPASLLSGLFLWWRPGESYQERQLIAQSPRTRCILDLSGNGYHGYVRSDHASAPVLPTFVEDSPL